jgi:hypothetical protein
MVTAVTSALAAVCCATSAAGAATNSGIPTLANWGVTSQCAAPYTGDNTAEIRDTAENQVTHTVFAVGAFGCAVSPDNTTATLPYGDLVPIDETTGAVVPTFAPHVFNGGIYAVTVDSADNPLVVGGDFTAVDGSATGAKHVAAFDLSTGVLQGGFNANVNGSVRSLLYHGGRLYVGGRFTAVQKATRLRLAAVDMPSGQLDTGFASPAITWTATTKTAATDVRTLALDDTATVLYAGGHFDTVGGSSHQSMVRMDASTGTPDATFAPALDVSTDPNYLDLQAVDQIVWIPAGLDGTPGIVAAQAAHVNRAYRFTVSGLRKWTIRPDGDVQAAAVSGSSVYLGGHFACLANCLKGAPSPAVTRIHIAAVDLTSGAIDTAFLPKMQPNVSPYFFGVWTLQVTTNGQLWVGGAFKTVQNSGTSYPRPKLAVFPPA